MTSILTRTPLALGFLVLASAHLHAAVRTWDGGAGDFSFSNRFNWVGDIAPVSNADTLEIGANTSLSAATVGFDTDSEFRTASLTFLSTATSAYTVTAANTVNDILTLNGTGVTLLNASPVRQTFNSITTNVGSAAQTWNGGAQGFVFAQVDLGNDRTLTLDGTGTANNTRNVISGKITGTGTSSLVKAGPGTLLFNANQPSDYTGATVVQNGRLQLGTANQIPDPSKLTLAGGTLDLAGFSDTAGPLLLGGSATIDFGTVNNASLILSDSRLELWTAGTLTILNFVTGADSFRIGVDSNGLTAGQLAQITFNGIPAIITSTGFLQPVPEAAASSLLASGLVALGHLRRRRSAIAPAA